MVFRPQGSCEVTMRRFEVYLDVQVPGKEASVEIVEMPDSATDAECEEACRECLDTMIANELDTGWRELPR
jgi:hypothetical protein